MILEALSLPFFQRVLLAGLLASLACGILGSYVVTKRITSLAGGLSHAAFGGVGIGYWLGVAPMLGAAGFAVAAGIFVGLAYRRLHAGFDMLISLIWAVGMALGLVFVALTPGYVPDLMSYLFGSLLFVSWEYVGIVALLDVAIVALVLLMFGAFQAVSFDEEFSEVAGLPVERLWLGLLALISLVVVALIRVVGVILVIALLTIPAAIGRHWASSLGRMMGIAVGVSALCTSGGLLLSYVLSEGAGIPLPPGPVIILLAALAFGASSACRRYAVPRS